MKILVAVDESEYSQSVVEAIATRAYPTDSSFRVLHVMEPFDPIEPAPLASSNQWALWVNSVKREKQAVAQVLVSSAAKHITDRFPQADVSTDVFEGYIVDKIVVDVAETWQADLIVVGSQGKRGFQRLLLGSVSNAILLHAPCSVEIVKRQDTGGSGTNGVSLKHILLCLDDSIFSDAALRFVQSQQWADDVCFKLVTVLKPLFELYGFEMSGLSGLNILEEQEKAISTCKSDTGEKAQKLIEKFGSKKVSVEVLIGDAREMILKAAADWPAHMIVMGSHSRQGLSKYLLGSVSQAVVMHAPCSVAVVK
ncbi:MAG: universal stress protein, partial [Candidatus Obscuribacterales bacterium]|nr:universal stress protein [Candidatus Obscuribacterales bacterium]